MPLASLVCFSRCDLRRDRWTRIAILLACRSRIPLTDLLRELAHHEKRRFPLRSSGKLLIVLLFAGIMASSVPVVAFSPSHIGVGVASISVMQVRRKDSELRRQVDQWLANANKAMQSGRYEEADFFIRRAEQAKLRYSPEAARNTYTPAKARTELNALRSRGRSSTDAQVERLPTLPPGSSRRLSPAASPQQAARSQRSRLPMLPDDRAANPRDNVFNRKQPTNPYQIRPATDPLRGSSQTNELRSGGQTGKTANGGNWPVRRAGYETGQENRRPRFPVQRGVYSPESDRTRNTPASADDRRAAFNGLPPVVNNTSEGKRLYQQGMKAFQNGDRKRALDLFHQAWKHQDQLDPRTRQDLQDKLNFLPKNDSETVPRGPSTPTVEHVTREQQVIRQKIQQDVFREKAEAEDMRKKDPKGALQRLRNLHDRVAESRVDGAFKTQLLNVVGKSIVDMEGYIDDHQAQINSDTINQARMEDVENRRIRRLEVQNELAVLVEQFNKLIDENRFPEADVLARQAYELAPSEPVVQNMMWKSRFAKRVERNLAISRDQEDGFVRALGSVQESGIPFDDREPYRFPDVTDWHDLTISRTKLQQELQSRRSPVEIQLQQTLRTEKVDVRFDNRPLREVLALLGAQAGVNIHVDQRGLHAEGVTSDSPVTINLTQPISLRSALNLILDDLNLSYVIQDEVIRVTSQALRNEQMYQKTYYVADLVIPIPNFVPSYNMGLPGAIAAAHNALGYGGGVPVSGSAPLTVVANHAAGEINPLASDARALANVGSNSLMGAGPSPTQSPSPFGPGGAGGGPQADFDSLIELITTTIAPTTWDEVGGPGSVSGFETNLSLVVSQTQEVHEQIADLLEQLRRLQDLQVTIEVRFLTLNDGFAEQIGVDFDFQIDDNISVSNQDVAPAIPGMTNSRGGIDDVGPSIMLGLDRATGLPTADFDIPFSTSLAAGPFTSVGGAAVPSIVGSDGLNTGFAILSDIEAFFLLQAAQADDRSNVMQAPKVTLFNGQQAFVSNTTQNPFVTSVIPVVGDFAAAHQPVIVVLSEGTSLSVQAVVSADRRFVRLTLVPFFSKIGNVQEFTFTGKTITKSAKGNADDGAGAMSSNDEYQIERSGTTVQLPQFTFQTVTTTVSVPDGGTVLLGGIKSLSEQRDERGVPLLSKLPYVNRLFRNVAIARGTQSLMMMVTPRIIIQEEEERNAVGRVLNP